MYMYIFLKHYGSNALDDLWKYAMCAANQCASIDSSIVHCWFQPCGQVNSLLFTLPHLVSTPPLTQLRCVWTQWVNAPIDFLPAAARFAVNHTTRNPNLLIMLIDFASWITNVRCNTVRFWVKIQSTSPHKTLITTPVDSSSQFGKIKTIHVSSNVARQSNQYATLTRSKNNENLDHFASQRCQLVFFHPVD